ncbi:MAG: sugar transferase [Verrucomicrobiales bacterium]|nr:sugar transferase [Verrucomicrobiales bacterium]
MRRLSWWSLRHGGLVVKRLFDLVAASAVLVLNAPLFLIVALLIKRDGGPVFFRQRRIGLHGREFMMWKFRSMCIDAEAKLAELIAKNEKAGGITFKMADDPRITRIGRFIRRTSIDELPQLINVLRGEMSIVGPRPPVPREVALYKAEDRRRFLAKPGLTCLWQIGERQGGLFEVSDRNAIDFEEQVELDVNYIERQNLWHDLRIVIKTPPAMLLGK